ncbi:MAG: hypothetical protein U0Q16_23675 [Bryobacteraceae bacterium]
MRIETEPEALAAMARSRETLNSCVYWTVTGALAAGAATNLYRVFASDQPWSRLAAAWMLGLIAYAFASLKRPERRAAGEPCLDFVERQHRERARGYLRFRRYVPLFLPPIIATAMNPAPPPFPFLAGPWPLAIVLATLVFEWWAMGAAAAKAGRDIEELHRAAGLKRVRRGTDPSA